MTSLVTEHSDWHPLHCLQPFLEADAQNNSTISRTETHTQKHARTNTQKQNEKQTCLTITDVPQNADEVGQ